MRAVPKPKQLDFLDWEMGAFFHFGIRSFFPGHKDWDGRPMPAEAFRPTGLDCGQWLRAVKAAGAKYAILTTKHHDGFANWPSAYSDYSVARSPWKDGKGDVVREFTDACRLYDMKVGLYYSPAQWQGKVAFDDDKAYDDYFVNQISELLSNYGKIDYLWFDGCGSNGHEYDRDRIISVIRSLQPDILIFSMWDPDTRWVGNEDGYAPMLCPTTGESETGQKGFLPPECDCKLRSTWFYDNNEDTIKSLDALVGMYEYSVGRGGNFLLNIGPDDRGLLPEKDVERLLEFGREIRRRYGKALPFGEMEETENGGTITLPGFTTEWSERKTLAEVSAVKIREDLTEGDGIRAFRVWATLPWYAEQEICLYEGNTVGRSAICRFPTFLTGRIRVEITDSEGPARITKLEAFRF